MCTEEAQSHGSAPRSAAEALRMMGAGLDYLNSPSADQLAAAAIGDVLTSHGELQAKFTAARATLLRRFDAADAHDADGYGSPASWLVAKTQMSWKDARAAVRQMRLLGAHRGVCETLAAGQISQSLGLEIAELTKKFPLELRGQTDKILLDAAAAGASLTDLKTIAAAALEQWRAQNCGPDPDDDGFDDRYVQVGTTFGGAACIRGNLTPECNAAVQAVLEALGKRHGPEDSRTEAQRFHDALQLGGCELLIRAKIVPDRAGADTQVIAHIPLSQLRQMPGASALEQAWLNARLGEPGYLIGKDAKAAACDATVVPVVTGHADMHVIDTMIDLALAAFDSDWHGKGNADDSDGGARIKSMSPDARDALRYAIARLAIDFVSGPNGLAGVLRSKLLDPPYNTPSRPLDIG